MGSANGKRCPQPWSGQRAVLTLPAVSEVRSCHYITRGVTKAWETKDRRLHFFDLTTNTIDSAPSLHLFAVEGLHKTETERTLTRRIEDSVGKFIRRCAKAGHRVVDFGEDDRMPRALAALIALQAQRTVEALLPDQAKFKLDDMLADEVAFNWFVSFFLAEFQLIGGTLTRGEWMVFPSSGWFAIPLMGHRPAMAMPLTPGIFVALLPRAAEWKYVESWMRQPHAMGAFSMLGTRIEKKLVIPAQIVEETDQVELIQQITELRADAREAFNVVCAQALAAGLPGYSYDD